MKRSTGSSVSLDLYAKAEHLLGIEDATEQLHDIYLQTLENYPVRDLLDIGCGRGVLMERLKAEGIKSVGIDQSAVMVEAARAKGLEAHHKGVCEAPGHYDAAVAVFDVLNFIEPEMLEYFFGCIADRLRPGGVFLADINTLHGFSGVADGVMSSEDDTHFLNVEATFDGTTLETDFTLFTHTQAECYRKEQSTIVQWFHPLGRLRNNGTMSLVHYRNISLYDTNDKMLLVFKK